MILVTIEYRPFRRLKYTRYLKGNFPQTFQELTAKQFIAVVCLVKNTIDNISFLQTMTGISKRILKKLDSYQQYKLMELFTIFNDVKPYNEFILQNIKTEAGIFYAPKPKLKGMTFGQFIFADNYFTDYQLSANPDDLQKFVATLYLPENTPFSENLIEQNVAGFKNVPPVTLEAVIINYQLIREWLAAAYPLVFVSEHDDEITDAKKQAKQNASSGWLKIFENLVGDDIINNDKYANLPVNNVFRYMSSRIKQNMKRKR